MRSMSASEDGVWIVGEDTKRVFKYNEQSRTFDIKGIRKSFQLSTSRNGHTVMLSMVDPKIYEWIEDESDWKTVDDTWSSKVTQGENGRIYKIDYGS